MTKKPVIKIAKPGYDASSAEDQDLIFNSNRDIIKVLGVIKGSYTITVQDYNNTYATFSFLHNQTIRPWIIGSFANSTDGISRQLNYEYRVPNQSYFGANAPTGDSHTASATVIIDYIDDSSIHIRVDMIDINGLSWLLSNSVLNFKFILLQETIASI